MENFPFVLWLIGYPLSIEVIRLIKATNGDPIANLLHFVLYVIVAFSIYRPKDSDKSEKKEKKDN